MNSAKYGRTFHFPFSPGTTSDDRIQYDYYSCIQKIQTLIHTEKLDGENNCLNRYGVFARSHSAPTTSPWTNHLRQSWESMKHDLGDLEIFGENLYAIHSIEYQNLDHYFFVFAIRVLDKWLSWEEVSFYAQLFDLPTVPVLQIVSNFENEPAFKSNILKLANEKSVFDSVDTIEEKSCSREGIVSRNNQEFPVEDLGLNVFKYVRKGHVKTDDHWTRNWRRAKLNYEKKPGV